MPVYSSDTVEAPSWEVRVRTPAPGRGEGKCYFEGWSYSLPLRQEALLLNLHHACG